MAEDPVEETSRVPTEPDALLNVPQISALLDMSEPWVRQNFPYLIRLGKRGGLRAYRRDVERFIDERRAGTHTMYRYPISGRRPGRRRR